MTTVILRYGVYFGSGDGSDVFDWEVDIDGKEEEAYLRAKKLRLPFVDFPVLENVISSVSEEIEDNEIDNFVEVGDDYTRECLGLVPVDPDEINKLVANRDPHTMDFFELTELSDKELEEWDANDLDELPDVCDFDENFEKTSPFGYGMELMIEFDERPDEMELEKDEAVETVTELLQEANGDYSVVRDYVERCERLYESNDGEKLADLVIQIAKRLGIDDFEI